MNKSGQIAIWTIIAIVIVAAIIILFILVRQINGPETNTGEEINPVPEIDKCTRKATEEAVEIMLPQGGFLSPTNYKSDEDIKIAYLCLNRGNYKTCINQHPSYMDELKEEIHSYIEPKIEECFVNLKSEMERINYAVEMKDMGINISLAQDKIFVKITRDLTISKNQETRKFGKFDVEVINPLYNLADVAIEISSQEAKYCYFEYAGYMILYPRFSIEKNVLSDSTKIYRIKDKNSNKVLNMAVRGCAIPGGGLM